MTAGDEVWLAIHGPISRADLEPLSQRCCAFFAENAGRRVRCDVGGVAADAVTVDALARLQRVASKNGCVVLLQGASAELRELVELTGLTDVLSVE